MTSQARRSTPLIPEPERQIEADLCDFETRLPDLHSSRPAMATLRDPVFKNKTTQKAEWHTLAVPVLGKWRQQVPEVS